MGIIVDACPETDKRVASSICTEASGPRLLQDAFVIGNSQIQKHHTFRCASIVFFVNSQRSIATRRTALPRYMKSLAITRSLEDSPPSWTHELQVV